MLWNASFKSLSLGLLAGIVLIAGRESHAEDLDYFSLPPDQLLNAEVISVSKKSETVSDAPAAVYVITQQDIQRSGVRSIPEALRMAPGVEVAQADANSWAISIRGFNSVLANKLLVMIDGRTVYNPLFAGTYWDLQDYVLEDIDRIEVIRGPGGTLWGANAVNGVINIITKSASDTQGNLVVTDIGTDRKGVSVRHGGILGHDGSFRVYGKYFDTDSTERPDGNSANDDWSSGRSGFRMDWGNGFTLQGDVYRTLESQYTSTPILTSPFALVEDERMASQGANLLSHLKKETSSGGLWSFQTYIDYTQRNQILLNDKRGIFDIETQYNFAPIGRNEVTMGGGYRYTKDWLSGADNVTFNPSSRADSLYNFFAQDKIVLDPDKWYLTVGSKFEYNNYTGFEFQPNVRLQYHPDEAQMVWAAVSRAVRTPSRLEHDLNETVAVLPPGTPAILFANRDFDSEKLVAYELGYRKQINPDLSVDITTFFNDYDDLTTVGFLPSSPGTLPLEAVNGMKGETYGAEISGTWNVSPDFRLTGSYSYLDMQLHVSDNGGFNLETAEEQSPEHQANLRASWNISDDVSLDTSAYYVSDLKANDVDDYVRLDLNLGWRMNDNVRFNLTGQNLLGSPHREFSNESSLNASEVERSVFGKLTWEF